MNTKASVCKFLSVFLCLTLILSNFSTTAIAETVDGIQNQLNQYQATDAEGDSDSVTLQDSSESESSEQSSELSATESISDEATLAEDATSAETSSEEVQVSGEIEKEVTTAALSSIIGHDEQGKELMYTTLYDADNKIISTNDPNLSIDKDYKSKDEGGSGKTVDLGASVRVFFRLADIIANNENGEGTGVQEGITYTMNIPSELVPVKEDADGKKLVDPDEPTTFFDTGDIQAKGGVYTKKDDSDNVVVDANGDPTYELRINFYNVADRVDVRGNFQYSTTVNEKLTPGSTVYVNYVPGGTVSFNVTPEKGEDKSTDYSVNFSGGKAGTTSYFISSTAEKKTEASEGESDTFAYKELTLEMNDGMGFLVDENNFSIFNGYGTNAGPGVNVKLVYSASDSGSAETWSSTASKDNIVQNSDGTTIVRLTSDKGVQVDIKFLKSDAVSGSTAITNGKNSYITQIAHVTVTNADGSEATNVKSVTANLSTLLFDDYDKTGTNAYQGTATLGGAADSDSYHDITAANGISAELGTFSTPSIGAKVPSSTTQTDTYILQPNKLYSYVNTSSGGYFGNYYWAEYNPSSENTANTNYYTTFNSFVENALFSSSSSDNKNSASFTTEESGTYVNGMVGSFSNWTYVGTVSVSQVNNDSNLIANSCFSTVYGSTQSNDVKLQYQLKQIFKDAPSAENLVVFRTQTPTSYGDYGWIVVDPDTNNKASNCKNNGWTEYLDADYPNSDSAKPGTWRLHFFNMPGTSFTGSQYSQIGSYYSNDNSGSGVENYNSYSGGAITNKISVGNGVWKKEATASATNSYKLSMASKCATSYMSGRWVSDDVLFWEFTFDAGQWASTKQGTFAISVPSGQRVLVNSTINSYTIGSSTFSAGKLYIKQTKGSSTAADVWDELDASLKGSYSTKTDINKIWEGPVNDSLSGSSANLCEFTAPNDLTSYRTNAGTSGAHTITIGFFTQVTGSGSGSDKATYEARAEVAPAYGSVSCLTQSSSASGLTPVSSGKTKYPIHVAATGSITIPTATKSGSIASTSGDPDYGTNKTYMNWTVSHSNFVSPDQSKTGNALLQGAAYGGYSGNLYLTDSMNDSYAEDSDGNKIEESIINVAKKTHIKSILENSSIQEARSGAGCGPLPRMKTVQVGDETKQILYGDTDSWEKLVNGQWVKMSESNCWDPENPGIYRWNYSRSSEAHPDGDPVGIYVYYAGNMGDSVSSVLKNEIETAGEDASASCFDNPLVVEYKGLRNAYNSYTNVLTDLGYTTYIDNEALINELNDYYKLEGGDALTSAYTLHVTNGASYGQSKYTSKSPSTIELKKTVTAALSIMKGTDGFAQNDNHHYQSKYTLDTTVGYSDTAYVNIQDFISYYKDSGYSVDGSEAHAYTANENTAGEDFVYNPEAISAITDSLSTENLTIVEVKPNGVRNTIFANGDFKNNSGYSLSSAFNSRDEAKELSDSEPGVLFTAKLMRDNGEDIPAGTKFEITYNLKINTDDEGGFRANDYYYGGTLAIGNDAIAERPYSVTRSADAADLTADEDGVISTQSVGDQTLQLAVANEDSDSDSNDGEISLAGGQVDPGRLVLRAWPDAAIENTFLTDEILLKYPVGQPTNDIGTSWMEYDWSGTIGKHKPNIRLIDNCVIVLNDLFAERTDLTDEQKEALRVKCASLMLDYITISDVKLYETTNKPYVTSTGTSLTDDMLIWQKDGVLNEDFTGETTNGHALTIGYTPATLIDFKETGRTEVQSPTFDIKVSDVDYGTYIASTYNINVDWEAYSKRLQEEDLLDNAGYATGTHQIPVFTFTNYVVNDRDMGSSSSSGEIKVSSTTFSKNVQETDTQAGNATWNLNTTLSNTFNGDAITFTDKPGFTAEDEAVAKAAEAATSIEDIQVKQGETVVFKDGKLTDEGAAAGWTADNVEVKVDGLSLEVKVKNTDSAKVLAGGSSYSVQYKTALDKDKFISEIVAAGGTAQDADYSVNNVGVLDINGTQLSSSKTSEFKPDVPISADKQSKGSPSDGTDTASSEFVASANTGSAARSNFTMTDVPTATSNSTDAAAAFAAMKVTSMNVTVTGEDGAAQTYSAEDILAGKVSGVTLKASDDSEFSLNKVGTFAWKLVFDKVEKNTTVDVDYVLTVDRDAYLAAGGNVDNLVNINNTISASTSDGSSATQESTGKVNVKADLLKKGTVLDKKSNNGNPVIGWNFDVNLSTIFDTTKIQNIKDVNIKDQFNQVLKPDTSSVKVYDVTPGVDGDQVSSEPLSADEYEVVLDEATNTLNVKLKNPSTHPTVRIYVESECLGSTSDLSNSVTLIVDGTAIDTNKTEVHDKLVAVSQYGDITSATFATWQPHAKKQVDGAEPGDDLDGAFTFEVTEVDESGAAVDGGYHATAKNNAAGDVTFDTISYRMKPYAADHYYKITEIADEEAAQDFDLDSTEYTVKVSVTKDDVTGNYVATESIVSPATTDVVFNNKTHYYSITINKTDESDNPLTGAQFTLETQEGETFPDGSTSKLISGDSSSYTVGDLKKGQVYTLTETQAPKGFDKLDPVQVSIGDGGKLTTVGDVPTGWVVDGENLTITAKDKATPDTPDTPDQPKEEKKESKESTKVAKTPTTGDAVMDGATGLAAIAVVSFAAAALSAKRRKDALGGRKH